MYRTAAIAPAVDFTAKTITCTKKFLKKAREFDSPEYHMMLQITRELPQFAVVTKEVAVPVRRRFQPTYAMMVDYIHFMDETPDEALKEFEHVRLLSRTASNSYSYVCNWFLNKYPAFAESTLGSNEYKFAV